MLRVSVPEWLFVNDLLLQPLVLFPLAACLFVFRRLSRRGSVSRLWFRLWLYTWRERVRAWQRQTLRRSSAASTREARDPAFPSPRRDALRRPVPLPVAAPPARDGVWVGNVFRPRAFQRMRGGR